MDRSNLPLFFFFNATATTEFYTLSLHDALPISPVIGRDTVAAPLSRARAGSRVRRARARSEEHTSELQSHHEIVCSLLLEKKKRRARTACCSERPTARWCWSPSRAST